MSGARWEVIHGDCLDVMRAMPDASVDAIVTDPPYASTGDTAIAASRTMRVPPETQFFESWLRDHAREWIRVLKPDGAMWLSLDWRGCLILDSVIARLGVRRPVVVGVWDKRLIGMGGILRKSFETFAIVLCDERKVEPTGQRDVWQFDWGACIPKDTEHPAEKPIALMREAVRLLAPKGGLVLDPFLGSGTTGVAALEEGCRFVGIEREAEYVSIARARIEAAARAPMFDFGGAK